MVTGKMEIIKMGSSYSIMITVKMGRTKIRWLYTRSGMVTGKMEIIKMGSSYSIMIAVKMGRTKM